MGEREKIIETLRASGYGYFVTHEKANADEALNNAADALIAAGYGEVEEAKRKAFVYSREIAHLDNKLKETEHRAEVAEWALSFLCGKTMSDISVMVFPSTKTQVQNKQELYDYCIKQAEKELTEAEE